MEFELDSEFVYRFELSTSTFSVCFRIIYEKYFGKLSASKLKKEKANVVINLQNLVNFWTDLLVQSIPTEPLFTKHFNEIESNFI